MITISHLTELKLSSNIKAVIFDCYGTLMEIKNKQYPYRLLSVELKNAGVVIDNYGQWIMTKNISLEEIENHFQIILKESFKKEFNEKLNMELKSITPFDETSEVLWGLKNKDIKIAMCSNLATPYGKAAKTKTILLNHYFLSYELGYIKPQVELFEHCQKTLQLNKEEVLFLGDHQKDDYQGALDYGFNAVHIKREK